MTQRPDNDQKQREDEELDEALKQTFPASDPVKPAQPGGDPSRS